MKRYRLGKIDPALFDKVIFPHLGAGRKDIKIGPRHGVDFGVVEIGNKAIVMSSDPVFIAPALGWEKAAWFAIHILASDVAVSGIMPTHLCIDLNLPPEMSTQAFKLIWRTIHLECKKMGMAVVSGHTARYAGCNYPMVGGATVFGIGNKKDLKNPANVMPGDKIVISKGPAIETTGLMSVQFPEFLHEKYGANFVKKAQDIFYSMSTVRDAYIASKISGTVCMHDATECGIWGGLYEMANAGGWGFTVDKDAIPIEDVVKKTCEVFDIDPYKAISEGTLIAIARPNEADKLVFSLERAGIKASVVGDVTEKRNGMLVVRNGKKTRLKHPNKDPFWQQFEVFLQRQADRKKRGRKA